MRQTILSSLVVGITLLAPVAVFAQDHDRRDSQQTQRYYDRQNKDWHEWNGNENNYYQRYSQQNHVNNKDFKRLSKRQQDQYFRWRHQQHDDAH